MEKQLRTLNPRSGFRYPSGLSVGFVILGLGLFACGPGRVDKPLIDAVHQPTVLTEDSGPALPASQAANRFVRGWRDNARRGRVMLKARDGARVQFVQLESRQRFARLQARVRPREGGQFEARVDGGDWFPRPLGKRVRIPIGADLGVGRHTIDFKVPEDAELVLESMTFDDPLHAGEVDVSARGDLVQTGYSIAEVVRKLDSAGELRGSFRPPSSASAGQRFSVRVETSQGTEEVFAWSAEAGGGVGEFSQRLPSGFVRVQFVAQGEGPAAEWRGLTLSVGEEEEPQAVEPPEPPKLVVLYIMDALRTDYLGHLGGPEGISPTIDRLANEGATFTNHFSVAPNTVPSTKSLLTGQKFLLKGGRKLVKENGRTLAQRYRDNGYRSGLFSGNGNVSSWLNMTAGFETDSSRTLWRGSQSRRRAGYNNNAEVIHRETLAWLDSLGPDERAFLHIQTVHPHNPYDPPEPYLSEWVPQNGSTVSGSTATLKGIRTLRVEVDENDQERLRGLYAASVAYNDAHIGDLLTTLLERYEPEDILFILTSDHGEELFEHGGVLHGYTLYDEMLRIPLVFWWPGKIKPRRVDALTDNVDLQATLASLVDRGADAMVLGDSLWPYLVGGRRASTPDKEVVFAAASSVKGGIFMARSERMKVVHAPRQGSRGGGRWGMGQGRGRNPDAEYVFDLVADPGEHLNLAGERSLEADWLWQQLRSWIDIGVRLEEGEEIGEMDAATEESLRALGYL